MYLLTGKIDISIACQADTDYIETGEALLTVAIEPGDNSQVINKQDTVTSNNRYSSIVNVNCGTGK